MARSAGAREETALVAVGGSAGALDALLAILTVLPAAWPLSLVVVVHVPRGGPSALPEVLGAHAALRVVEAEDKQPLAPGTVHVARPGYHLLVDVGPRLALSVDEPVHHALPSIDVLFESAAATCGPRAAAVLLSGANEDGAAGLAAVGEAGGVTLVQSPEDARVATMPRAGLARWPAARALPASGLGEALRALAAARTEER